MTPASKPENLLLGIAKSLLLFPAMVVAGLFVFLFFNILVLPVVSVIQLIRLAVDPGFRRRVADAGAEPAGSEEVYYHPRHPRLSGEQGAAAIGPDEFTGSLLNNRTWEIEAAVVGLSLETGDTVWRLKCGNRKLEQGAPICGTVIEVNARLLRDPSLISRTPIRDLWIVKMKPARAIREFTDLISVNNLRRWNDEVKDRIMARFGRELGAVHADGGQLIPDLANLLSEEEWNDLVASEYR